MSKKWYIRKDGTIVNKYGNDWFERVSRHGKRFVDFASNPDYLKFVTEDQRKYLKSYLTINKAVPMNRETYMSLGTTENRRTPSSELKRNHRLLQQRIFSGQMYFTSMGIVKGNYMAGLTPYIREKYEFVYDRLSQNERERFMDDLPSLFLFYKDMSRNWGDETKRKARNDLAEQNRNDQLEQADITVNRWLKEKGLEEEFEEYLKNKNNENKQG